MTQDRGDASGPGSSPKTVEPASGLDASHSIPIASEMVERVARAICAASRPPVSNPYRPSCGSEGAVFIEEWCGNCKRDQAFREDDGDSCPIVAATFAFDIDEPGYPVEWQYKSGRPICTAFDEIGRPEKRDEAAAVGDLFAGPPVPIQSDSPQP